jgi:hypothetical protein
LNHAQPWLSLKFFAKLEALRERIHHQDRDKERVLLVGESVLAAYGLRGSGQVDCLCLGQEGAFPELSSHTAAEDYLNLDALPINDLFFDPRELFYYRGIKFMAISTLSSLLRKKKTTAVFRTRRLIDSLEGRSPNLFRMWRNLRFWIKRTRVMVANVKMQDVKNLVPASLYAKAKQVYHALFHPD